MNIIIALAAVLALCVTLGLAHHITRKPPPDPDPYACFGAGRYEAMRNSQECDQ